MLQNCSSWKMCMWDCLRRSKHQQLAGWNLLVFNLVLGAWKHFNSLYHTLCPSKLCPLLLFLPQGHLCSVLACFVYCTNAASAGLVACVSHSTRASGNGWVYRCLLSLKVVHGAQLNLLLGLHLQLLHHGTLKPAQVMNISNARSQTKPLIRKDLFPGFLAVPHKQLLTGL